MFHFIYVLLTYRIILSFALLGSNLTLALTPPDAIVESYFMISLSKEIHAQEKLFRLIEISF
ncbi:hypothetical protein PSHI8_13960 [Polynucleobacter sp. SHI8]|nr:hypothetical protein PSHI2_13960 [Polynucleobacter sp. SHI2]BDW13760.1 hypothetical protein PSHI8_13960 [Polynucleobacter sp. SHI8]